ncbi:MAG: 30S ribosomal protein S5, partial [Lachnospiraceae bacterium]
EDATKKLVEVPIDPNGSVPHDFIGKFGSASVLIKKAPEGTGIIAGGPARAVLELAGYKNIRTKSLGSNNKQNVVLAAINGLDNLKRPEDVAKARGISLEELLS